MTSRKADKQAAKPKLVKDVNRASGLMVNTIAYIT
jgi:hypothetical protein